MVDDGAINGFLRRPGIEHKFSKYYSTETPNNYSHHMTALIYI